MSRFAVHVMGSRSRVVPEPNSEILDLEGLSLLDFFHADNLASGLLELAKLTQKVPKSRLCDNGVRREDSHSVERSLGFIGGRQFAANHLEFTESSTGLHRESKKISLLSSIEKTEKERATFYTTNVVVRENKV